MQLWLLRDTAAALRVVFKRRFPCTTAKVQLCVDMYLTHLNVINVRKHLIIQVIKEVIKLNN